MKTSRPPQKIVSVQCLEDESRSEQEAREARALRESERYTRRRFRESQTNVSSDVAKTLFDAADALEMNPDDVALQELVSALKEYTQASSDADEIANEPLDDDFGGDSADDSDVDDMSESQLRTALLRERARR